MKKLTPHLQSIKNNLKPIRSKKQYKEYLLYIDQLVDCDEHSPEEDLLELVAILVADYENKKYPIEPPDAIDAVKSKMQELGLKKKDLAPYFGSASRVSEILNRKRPMTLEMLKKVHKGLHISAETLLG